MEDTTQTTNEGVGPIGSHRINHHTPGPASRERLHQSRGQRTYEVGIAATSLNTIFDAVDEHIHCPRSTEHTNGYKNRNEIRDDADGCRKALLRSLDEGLVDIYLLPQACQDKGDDDHHQQDIRRRGAHLVHQHGVELSEAPDDGSHHHCGTTQRQEDGTV